MARSLTAIDHSRGGDAFLLVTGAVSVTLAAIYRFPVKGLRGEPLDSVDVVPGQGLPHDRRFALTADGVGSSDGAFPWRPKQRFAMLMRNAELARLACRVDFGRETVELVWPGEAPCVASYASAAGRAEIAAFANRVLAPAVRTPLRFVEAGRLSLTDVPENCLSIINLASVRDLERRMGATIHPLRFRGNLLIEGGDPWTEFDWVGSEVRVGAGRLRVHARIPRCAATGVNPDTAARDVNVLKGLKTHLGHVDMGVYAEVLDGGRLAVGDTITPPTTAHARSRIGHQLRFVRFLARSARLMLRRR